MRQVQKAYLMGSAIQRVLADSRGQMWDGQEWVEPALPVVKFGEVYRSPYTVPTAWAGPVWWAR